MTVAQILQIGPQTAHIFLKHRMDCVGCPMAAFETLAEAAGIYGHRVDTLLKDLRRGTNLRKRPNPARRARA